MFSDEKSQACLLLSLFEPLVWRKGCEETSWTEFGVWPG